MVVPVVGGAVGGEGAAAGAGAAPVGAAVGESGAETADGDAGAGPRLGFAGIATAEGSGAAGDAAAVGTAGKLMGMLAGAAGGEGKIGWAVTVGAVTVGAVTVGAVAGGVAAGRAEAGRATAGGERPGGIVAGGTVAGLGAATRPLEDAAPAVAEAAAAAPSLSAPCNASRNPAGATTLVAGWDDGDAGAPGATTCEGGAWAAVATEVDAVGGAEAGGISAPWRDS
ncbi:MAG: hypothetical protein ACREFV_00125 [Acetobacteraceae bacterium]